MSSTGTVASLVAHEPEPRVSLHPDDLSRLKLKSGDLAKVSSRWGELHVTVSADASLQRGLAFLRMHWGGAELKHCAVRVEPAQLPWRLVAFGPADFDVLTPLMQAAPFVSRTLIGRDRRGVLLRMAASEPIENVKAIDDVFGLDEGYAVRYEDVQRASGRRISMVGGAISAARLSGDTRSEAWLKDMWERACRSASCVG